MSKPPLTTAKEFKIAVLTLIGVRIRNEARTSIRHLNENDGIKYRERVMLLRNLYDAVQAIPSEYEDNQ